MLKQHLTPLVILLAAAVLPSPAHATAAHARVATVAAAAPDPVVRLRAPWRFQLAGAHWRGRGRLQLRARRVAGGWTRWVPVSRESPAFTGAAVAVELRRVGRGRVRRLRVSFVDSPPQPASLAPLPARVLRPAIITRTGWGADESLRRDDPEIAPALRMVFVHHTDTASSYPCSESARIVRGIYAYHVLSNGWDDIGYNFLIDRCGRVFEGRFGGVTRPVVGAHARGFNTGSAGIAMIGTFTSVPPTPAARRALRQLIAWRLDVAHVDPTSRLVVTTSGNERFRPGARVRLRAVSGHRDTGATSCPGAALYALLPRVASSARRIGLPKIFAPRTSRGLVRTGPGGVRPIRFRGVLSHAAAWTLTVRGPAGRLAVHHGSGSAVDWTWDGEAPLLPGGSYRWSLSSPDARPARRSLGDLRRWRVAGGSVAVGGDVVDGDAASLASGDGDLVITAGTPSALTTVNRLDLTQTQFAAATRLGASLRMPAGGVQVAVELWDYGTSSWVGLGSCTSRADRQCLVLEAAPAGDFGHWLPGPGQVEMRVRYSAAGPIAVDSARAHARE